MTSIRHNLGSAWLVFVLAAAARVAVGASAVECTNFDPPDACRPRNCCAGDFTDDGIGFSAPPYHFPTGTRSTGGFVEPQLSCYGDRSRSLNVSDVNAEAITNNFPGSRGMQRIRFTYRDAGAGVNLRVNGHLEFAFDDLHAIPAAARATIGV
jgi:hypothetical protein